VSDATNEPARAERAFHPVTMMVPVEQDIARRIEIAHETAQVSARSVIESAIRFGLVLSNRYLWLAYVVGGTSDPETVEDDEMDDAA
jgi:hypothetical protein